MGTYSDKINLAKKKSVGHDEGSNEPSQIDRKCKAINVFKQPEANRTYNFNY